VVAHNGSEWRGSEMRIRQEIRGPRVVWRWRLSGNMGGMASDDFDDNPLEPDEELDSDEIRNDDGDEVVDPPEEWIDAKDNETLDERLAEEAPDDLGDDESGEPPSDAHDSDAGGGLTLVSNDEIDRMDPDRHGRERGQIDGTPEDGDSFYDVIE
jgi:hypothetical protein